MNDNIWICPECFNELGLLNGYCLYCKIERNNTVYNPDKYYVRDVFLRHTAERIKRMEEGIDKQGLQGEELLKAINDDPRMTPQEKLHATFFYHERVLVKDMDTLTLRAHREELSRIAFEARSRISAVDAEEADRKKQANKDNKPTGFQRSLNVDETTTNAINTIKERKQRMSKAEKVLAGLEKLGINTADAQHIMSAGTVLGRIKSKTEQTQPTQATETKPFVNPFEKK